MCFFFFLFGAEYDSAGVAVDEMVIQKILVDACNLYFEAGQD